MVSGRRDTASSRLTGQMMTAGAAGHVLAASGVCDRTGRSLNNWALGCPCFSKDGVLTEVKSSHLGDRQGEAVKGRQSVPCALQARQGAACGLQASLRNASATMSQFLGFRC
jgi:hypothetical protein